MEKVVRKIKLEEHENETLEFWQSKTDIERISAIQVLREQFVVLYNKEDEYNESRKRLRRFYRVIKQVQS